MSISVTSFAKATSAIVAPQLPLIVSKWEAM